ncbi:HTH domain-containing protein [Desulfobulbus alkaliphilus]|uniref:HTH domain-containing protein n=1 Tax=Desulfobulbus alkaliphilus TaxID=869814 RepID=UPI001964CEB6|nr:HTH domain-containing protein [Desulfobulbus alkaliphilus]MBM9538844.1 restriction endonuclease [Desulfobulbus alkaliphilus]
MDLKSAVIQVLQQAGTALHTKDITEQVMAAGLWHSGGKTPNATVSARLYSEIKSNGDKSPFVKVGPQTFALRESTEMPSGTGSVPLDVQETTNPSSANAGFSFTECAQKVLEMFGGKKPMHYKEVTAKAIEKGWLITGGKTPDATMYAQVITEIKRQQKRGERPRFVQHGRGYIGLSQWLGRGLAFQIEQHNHQVRKALRERLLIMKPGEFEELISQLLAEIGFEMVEVTKLSGDGGIDVRGTLVVGDVIRIKMAVQVKKWKLKNNIQAPVVQQVRGSLGAHEQGLIITTSDFSPGAIKEAAQADKTPIALMNGEQLVMLLMEHGIGVHRSTPDLFEIDEEFVDSVHRNESDQPHWTRD